MIGDEVDDHFQAAGMGAFHQCLKFGHAVWHIDGKVGIDVVVIFNGVWRSGISFDNEWVVVLDTIGGIIGFCGMFDNAGIPNMCGSKVGNGFNCACRYVVQFATAVLLDAAIGGAMLAGVGK